MGELLITYRYHDPTDHMSEKTETIKVADVEDKQTAYLYAGIMTGSYWKFKQEAFKQQQAKEVSSGKED